MEARSQLQRALDQQNDDEKKFPLVRKYNIFMSAKKDLPSQLPSRQSIPKESGAASLYEWGVAPESAEFMMTDHPIVSPELILENSISLLAEEIQTAKVRGDEEMKATNDNEVEATINASLITGNMITTANVGDCRAMLLFRRRGDMHFSCMRLSFDHIFTQSDAEERTHIKDSRKKKIAGAIKTKTLYHSDIQSNYTRILGRETLSHSPTITRCDLTDFHEAYLINVTGALTSIMQEKHIAELVTANKTRVDESENPAQFLANFLRDEVRERSRNSNTLTILVTDVSSHVRNKEVSILAFVSDGKNGDTVSQFVKRHFIRLIEMNLRQQASLNEENKEACLQDKTRPRADKGEKEQQPVSRSTSAYINEAGLPVISSNPSTFLARQKKPKPAQVNNPSAITSCQLI